MTRLTAREFVPSDKDALMAFVRDPSQLRYMLFDLATEPEVDDFLTLAQDQAGRTLDGVPPRTQWHWALEERGRPGVVGSVALIQESASSSSAELGYWFRREAWGKGYATEASRFALEFGFRALKVHRIWGKCHVDNAASARVMEKLGMVKEGLIREHVWLRDHWRSSYQFALLDREFP